MTARISSSRREVEHRRELFIAAYASSGNASAAAVSAGYSPNGAPAEGARLLRDVRIGPRAREARQQYVESTMSDFQRQQRALCEAADASIATLVQVAANPPRVGAQAMVLAAVAILDRAGHKPVERIESAVAWADVSRELDAIDTAAVLREALQAISERPDALPGPDAGEG